MIRVNYNHGYRMREVGAFTVETAEEIPNALSEAAAYLQAEFDIEYDED